MSKTVNRRTGLRLGVGMVALAALTAVASLAVGRDATVTVRKLEPPLGLPPLPAGREVIDPGKVALGRALFFERRLSFNNTLSCGMCHLESDAFASTQTMKAVGMEGRSLRRNAPTLLNVVYQRTLLHDGREHDLALQVWLPILAADEMANPSIGYALQKLGSLDGYADAFAEVYPGRGITMETVADAVAAFEATLLSGGSRFDQWRFGGKADALTAEEQAGFELFTGKANCVQCHEIGAEHALFTDHGFHNTGIGYRATMLGDKIHEVQLAPGTHITVRESDTRSYSEIPRNDVGRFEVTLAEADRWAYKTPSLREVTRTWPYMHDGSIATLEEVVAFYNDGGIPNADLSPRIRKLGLTADEQRSLVAFLGSLEGVLQAEARARTFSKE